MSRLRPLWACLSGLLVAGALLACADLSTVIVAPSPGIVLPAQFHWHTVNPGHQDPLALPITAQRPGPTITVPLTHESGVGAPVYAANALGVAGAAGQQVMATEIARLTVAGWQALFTPTVTGSFPQYVLYTTLRSGAHYCFVEFSASALTRQEASQQLDVYHN
jgi:hypothetical protein